MNRYNVNFTKSKSGNALQKGYDLIVNVEGAKIITGILSKKTRFGWKRIQIEQSGHRNNPQQDCITFEMKKYSKDTKQLIPMPKGTYQIQTWAYIPSTSSYGNGWKDKFEII